MLSSYAGCHYVVAKAPDGDRTCWEFGLESSLGRNLASASSPIKDMFTDWR